MTIAKTGTEVTRTAIGNSTLTIVIKTLFWSELLKVASISDDASIWKLAAPSNPMMRYKVTQTTIGYMIEWWMETLRDSSLMNDGTVVTWGDPGQKYHKGYFLLFEHLRMPNC